MNRWPRRASLGAGLWLALCICTQVHAHSLTTGLATLDARTDRPAYRLTLNGAEMGASADDLRRAAAGDAKAAARLAEGVPQWLALEADGRACRVARLRVQSAAEGAAEGEARLVVAVDFACGEVARQLVVTDRWWQPFGEHHRTILGVTRPDGSREERVLDREHPQGRFDLGAPAAGGFAGFVGLGLTHILSGADHLLFLAALLAGSQTVWRLLLTVTAFTLAHSVALALAVLGFVHMPAAIVEPLIAASIVWVAAENLWLAHASPWRRVALAFGFGLVHGLAFSEVLAELSLAGWALVRALLGFNLGVEIGQAVVVVALAPLLAWAARRPAGRRVERWGSAAVGTAGLVWLVQRLTAV